MKSFVRFVLMLFAFVTAAAAFAVPGDILKVVFPALTPAPDLRGVTFDGKDLWMSGLQPWLHRVDTGTWTQVDAVSVHPVGMDCTVLPIPIACPLLAGLAWDSKRGVMWAGSYDFAATVAAIVEIDVATGDIVKTLVPPVPLPVSGHITALTYNLQTDTLRYGGDGLRVEIGMDGTLLAVFPDPLPGAGWVHGMANDGVCYYDHVTIDSGPEAVVRTWPSGVLDWQMTEPTYVLWDLALAKSSEFPGLPLIIGVAGGHMLVMEGPPPCSPYLAVTWGVITVNCVAGGIEVAWETFAEYDTVGFIVERGTNGSFSQVGGLVLAVGGGKYKSFDLTATVGATYRVREITTSGMGDISPEVTVRCGISGARKRY